jgi:hypothetical protein
MDKAKIIKGFDWYSNKVGIIVEVKGCDFPHLYLAKDDSTLCWRQILKEDVEVIKE